MAAEKKHILFYFLLLILLLIAYVSGLFIDVTRDAAKYAYIAKEMALTNHWLDIRILDEPYEQKPHFMFWLSAISFKFFGISNFAFKLPVFLFSLLGVYFTYRLGKTAYNKKTGITAAVIIMFSMMFVLYNMDLHTDTPLFTFSALALWQLYEYLKFKRNKNLLLSAVALGFALLTKGPFGVMLPVLSVFGFLIHKRHWKKAFNPRWGLLIVLSFLIASPALIHLYRNFGTEGISFFFFQNTYGRFTGEYMGHTPDPFFYVHNMAHLLLPWSLVFFGAIILGARKIIKKNETDVDRYLFRGIIIFFIIISISLSKLPNYLMCAFPAIALLSAHYWHEAVEKNRLFRKLQTCLNYVLITASVVVIFHFLSGSKLIFVILPIFVTSLYIFLFRKTESEKKLYTLTLTSASIAALSLNLVAVPMLFSHQAQPKVAKIANQMPEHIKIYNYPKSDLKYIRRLQQNHNLPEKHKFKQTPDPLHFSYNYELMFYTNKPVQYIETDKQLETALKTPTALFYTDFEGMEIIRNSNAPVDTIYTFEHFSLKRTAKLLFPKKGESPFVDMYLVSINHK